MPRKQAKHPKQVWFERGIIAASEALSLLDAAAQWEFSHMDIVPEGKRGNCQLCHASMVKFVVIVNTTSSIRLAIGADCYKKLRQFLEDHGLESAKVPRLEEHEREIREYGRRKYIDAAMLAWMRRQELPAEIRKVIATIDRLGYPGSMGGAELVVDYYRNRRFFTLKNTQLIKRETRLLLQKFPHRDLLPRRINLTGVERLEALLKRWREKERQKAAEKEDFLERTKLFDAFRRTKKTGIAPLRCVYGHALRTVEIVFIHKFERLTFMAQVWSYDPLAEYVRTGEIYIGPDSQEYAQGFGMGEIEWIVEDTIPGRLHFLIPDYPSGERIVVSEACAQLWAQQAQERAAALLGIRKRDRKKHAHER